jgi:sulfide:quinone oxidoreductase
MSGQRRRRIVIAGGGVAGLECLIALRELAGKEPEIVMLAPEEEFVYRPMAVLEPFSFAAAHHYALARIAADHGAELRRESLGWVDGRHRTATTVDGEELHYDALMLATGATRYKRYAHALTVDDQHIDDALHGLIQDIEGGYTGRVAFVMPPRAGWPLPLYEFALLTARRAKEMCIAVELTVVTPEEAPLAIFGEAATVGVASVLADAGISVLTSAHAAVPDGRHVQLSPGGRTLEVDRIVALPQLMGPGVRGVPLSAYGFIPVAPNGEVRAMKHVYAAGDGTDFPVKQGGIAAQQADVAAASIADQLGFEASQTKFEPVLRGMLLTGSAPLYMTARLIGGAGFTSTLSDECPWSPPAKIAAKHLGPYLERLDRVELQSAVA